MAEQKRVFWAEIRGKEIILTFGHVLRRKSLTGVGRKRKNREKNEYRTRKEKSGVSTRPSLLFYYIMANKYFIHYYV